jgi:hypothetical protein
MEKEKVMEIEIGNKKYSPSEVREKAAKAAGWFIAVMAFSVINSALTLMGADLSFVIGLGTTMMADGIMIAALNDLLAINRLIGIVVSLLLYTIGFVPMFIVWKRSKNGSKRAYLLGMVLYLIDGFIFVAVGDLVGIGFHAFFLFSMWGGYQFIKKLEEARSMENETYSTVSESAQPNMQEEGSNQQAISGEDCVLDTAFESTPPKEDVAEETKIENADRESSEYLNVVLSKERISQIVDGNTIFSIEKKDIIRAELVFGLSAEHPIVQLAFGSIILIVGLFPLEMLYVWITQGGTISVIQMLIFALIPLSLWIIRGALRKKHFILVDASTDRRKFIFDGEIEMRDLRTFLENARNTWHYKIASNL